MTTEEISDLIIDELDKHNMTALDLARKIGVSYNLVKMYIVEERTPRMETFRKILDVFGKKIQIVDK